MPLVYYSSFTFRKQEKFINCLKWKIEKQMKINSWRRRAFLRSLLNQTISTNKNDVRNQSSSQANPQASSSLASTFPHFYPYYADLQATLVLNPFTGYWERILIPQNQFHRSWYNHQWDLNLQPCYSNPVSSIVSETNRKQDEIPTTTTG